VVLMLPLTWLALTRVAFSIRGEAPAGVRELIAEQRAALGKWSGGERGTLAVFALAGLGWVTSTWTGLPDAAIAVLAAALLFVIPAGGGTNRALLTWSEGAKVPWGVLLLFGGGLSLAAAASATGVDAFLATRAEVLGGAPLWLTLFVVALAAILMTEFMSNTALVAIALPVVLLMAEPLGVPPAALLVTVTLAASLGFALPAGTAPNALVFSSGRVTIREMIRGGIVVDVAAAVLVPLVVMGAMKVGLLPGE
jgi:sodium-dependent dicarboxylate transporter 2/3/5